MFSLGLVRLIRAILIRRGRFGPKQQKMPFVSQVSLRLVVFVLEGLPQRLNMLRVVMDVVKAILKDRFAAAFVVVEKLQCRLD